MTKEQQEDIINAIGVLDGSGLLTWDTDELHTATLEITPEMHNDYFGAFKS